MIRKKKGGGATCTIIIAHEKARLTDTNRITSCLLVVSVQAVDQYRKDPGLNQVIYGRVTVTGQQLPTKTKKTQHSVTDKIQLHTERNI